jgi:hypothetical protein
MTRFLIKLIEAYQKGPSFVLASNPFFVVRGGCRYIPTCSEYAEGAIEKYGPIKGSFKALGRILRCNPFSKGGIDNI